MASITIKIKGPRRIQNWEFDSFMRNLDRERRSGAMADPELEKKRLGLLQNIECCWRDYCRRPAVVGKER